MPKKLHPADIADREKVATATHFNVHLRLSPTKKINHETPTLAEAATIADRISADNGGKQCLVYGITPEKMTVLVPMDMLEAVAQAQQDAKGKRPGAKRTAVLEAAQRGELPAAPDFSAETHKRFRPKLAKLIELAEAADIAGLKTVEINPVSSSPKAMLRYRDICLTALLARSLL